MAAAVEGVRADPFLLDSEALRALASEAVVQRGLAYYAEHRVTDLGWDAERVWAHVEGSQLGLPYLVEIGRGEGELTITCGCAEWEADLEPSCKHGIAVLAAYAARHAAGDGHAASAAEQAIAERVQRARTEVIVEHVAGAVDFGTWSARSLAPSGASLRPYTVHIRSRTQRMNACSCPDFATNRLGTCKHIEAVLHKLAKGGRRKGDAKAADTRPSVVYVAWDAAHGPEIRVHRQDPLAPATAAALDRHFDARGALRGSLPDAFFHAERALALLPDVHIAEDAAAHARRLAEDLAHAARARSLRDDILRSGGHLPGVRARLYPYQVEGVAFLAATGRALLADDMGLGKTLQAIAAARTLMDREGVAHTLIVCPASLKFQWAREIQRFTGLDAEIVQGGVAPRLAQYRRRPAFTLVNYELVLRDREAIANDLAPDLVILDEAQRIKNWRTRTASAVKAIPSRYAFVLTGTPLENRLEDLYSVMQVVDPRVLGPLWQFMAHFHVTDERGKALGYRNLSELRRRLAPVMLRRDKRLVRDQLPDKIEQRIEIALSAKQRTLHNAALQTAQQYQQIQLRRPLTPIEEKLLLSALQTARMACNAAGLVDKETVGSPKLDELARILEEVCVDGGKKIVVFSQWERMTHMAEEVARSLNLGVARLHGGVPTSARGALIGRFHDDPECQVFLSTDAGATGLNLQCATVLVNLELPYNPATLGQRIARIHRLGQREPVQIIHLVAAESYEERVAALIATKRDLFTAAVEPEATDDVVGLSPRALAVALEALGDTPAPHPGGESDDPPAVAIPTLDPAPAVDDTLVAPLSPEPPEAPDESLAPLVQALQEVLGAHLERLLVTQAGLVALIDVATPDLVAQAEALAGPIPVAVLDGRTWAALTRVAGAAFAQTREAWSRPTAPQTEPPLAALARRKLHAAEALLPDHPTEALDLLTTAMTAALAHRAGQSTLPDRSSLAVWLYSDLLPSGHITPDLATTLLRTHALSQSPSIPPDLAASALTDARRLVAEP